MGIVPETRALYISIVCFRHAELAEPALLPGQRQDPAPGLRAAEHVVVLRRRGVRREGHQADAELRQNQVQAHQYR